MDFLIKIKSFCLLCDIRPEIARSRTKSSHLLIGTFENYEWYGWFIEGKHKDLLVQLLRETKNGEGKAAFPYLPSFRKKISSHILDYEVWYPISRKASPSRPERHLGWSRTNDLYFSLPAEQVEQLKVGPMTVFTVLCYSAKDEFADKWKRTVKVKGKKVCVEERL